jgi:adenylate kinase
LQAVRVVLNITLPERVLMEKMLARRTCADCGRGYNLANIKEGAAAGAKMCRQLPPSLPCA